MPVEIAGLVFKNPLIVASGISALSQKMFDKFDKNGAGAIVSKSISLFPREGYNNPSVFDISENSYINAVGLANPGVEYFKKEISQNKTPLIVSLVGSEANDFTMMIEQLNKLDIIGYELNLSCPHVERMGLELGDDPIAVDKIIKSIKLCTGKPLFVKIGIGNSNIIKIAKIAENAGADGITAINTVRAMKINTDTGFPVLDNKIGGLSGLSIKPIGIRSVYELKKSVGIPIIGCGGIMNHLDVLEYLMAGASAVQLGSVIGIRGLDTFSKILTGLKQYMKRKKYKDISEIIGISQEVKSSSYCPI
ncbi:MAG: dihydroorotate dehydrogenase [Thermoproteota archaeon]|nr:dihydroorotate dehydrogenase [Thermoproteota archaeon]